MRFPIAAMVRLALILGAFLCVLAISVARLAPRPPHVRTAALPRYELINAFVLDPYPGDPQLLDPQTGEVRRFHAPRGDRLEYAACSPWTDDEGEFQLVGRWSNRQTPAATGEVGLARYKLPSGRVLDQIPLEIVPASNPCWFPGTSARVLFAGSDGQLYRLSFETEPGTAARGGTSRPRPTPVTWLAALPGPHLTVFDSIWPGDPRMAGRLILTLGYQAHQSDKSLCAARLWWAKLSADGSAVCDAGPLTDPGQEPGPDRGEERYPNLAVAPDGRLLLAYLRQGPRMCHWELHLAGLGLDPATGRPCTHTADDRILTREHEAAQPLFSADRRTLFGVLNSPGQRGRVVRFPLATSAPPSQTAAHSAGNLVPRS